MENTVGMFMELDRFNRLSEIEQANTVVPAGVRLVIVRGTDELGLILPPTATLRAVFITWVQVYGKTGVSYELHSFMDTKGIILENARPIKGYGFAPWQRLFLQIFEKPAEAERGQSE